MKTKYPSMFGVLAAFLLVASFIIPTSLASPSPVQAGVCKWDQVEMPGSILARFDVGWIGPSDVQKVVVGNDGATVLAVVNFDYTGMGAGHSWPWLMVSPLMGILWDSTPYQNLMGQWNADGGIGVPFVFDVVIAPDNPKFWAVLVQDPENPTPPLPDEVYVTENGGGKWTRTRLNLMSGSTAVGAMDISVDYGGQRDIAVGMRLGDGTAAFAMYVIQTAGFAGWNLQTVTPPDIAGIGDIFALKISPTYAADGAIAVVFTTATVIPPLAAGGTFYNIALRDIDQNDVNQWAFPASQIVGDPTAPVPPTPVQLISADLELPSDFNGQAASLRRAYVSTDSGPVIADDGIYRFDNTTRYELMDTSADAFRRISSIAYFGTYASGKLLAGSVLGYRCEATVPTWFTDSPTTCPVPCWYDCLKCPTGSAICEDPAGDVAACEAQCMNETWFGNAQVVWFQNGALAFAGTATYNPADTGVALCPFPYCWWMPLLHNAFDTPNDETALSISRNNGETWNQLAFIDTTIDAFNDVVPSADCQTLYLASWNDGCGETGALCTALLEATCDNSTVPPECTVADVATDINCTCGIEPEVDITSSECQYDEDLCGCAYHIEYTFTWRCDCPPFCSQSCSDTVEGVIPCGATENITLSCPCSCAACCGNDCCLNAGFDSVWRSSLNPAVVGPLPPLPPLGFWYERVYTRPTALNCCEDQTDLPIIRLAGGCEEPTGQIIGWAAQDTRAEAWSPDYGDYWANITARWPIQDFAFESQTILYNLYRQGTVQKMPYTGTAWGTTLADVNTGFGPGHTIAAMAEGQVLVGFEMGATAPFPASISKDGGATFSPLMQPLTGGDIHVAFDPDYANNSIIYIGDDTDVTGHVYRMNVAGAPLIARWQDNDMMSDTNNADGCPPPNTTNGIYGVALAYTGGTLYAADGCGGDVELGLADSGVWRTLDPLAGIPKPGIVWDRLDVFTPNIATDICFTLEPYSLKLCGCCTMDTDTTLYAIDDNIYSGVAHTTGFLWAFTDCMAKKGPALITEDKALIGCDPVSGRAGEVNLCWEQLCVASRYDLEIAKDADFTIRVIDIIGEGSCGGYPPADVTKPCAFFPAGGRADWYEGSAIALWGNLECGHTYYWRVKVRECVTGQDIRSPWSGVRSFTVKAGYPVVSQYPGLQLLAPANGALGIPVKPVSFSWSPFGDAAKYKFVLAKDAAMTQVVTEAEVPTTAYAYDGTLDNSTNYFWRVMALDPAPSDWSATFSFQTEGAPPPVTPEKPAPTPVWVWVVIAIGAILVIVTLVLIFKTRRV